MAEFLSNVAELKNICESNGIKALTDFDESFAEYFLSAISNDENSQEQNYEMLIGLIPKVESLDATQSTILLNDIVNMVKRQNYLQDDDITNQTDTASTIESTNKHHNDSLGVGINDSLQSTNKLATYELDLSIKSIKELFMKNAIHNIPSKLLGKDDVISLLELMASTDDITLQSDILHQYFIDMHFSSYIIESIRKLMKGCKYMKMKVNDNNLQSIVIYDTILTSDQQHQLLLLLNTYSALDEELIQYVYVIKTSLDSSVTKTILQNCIHDKLYISQMTQEMQNYHTGNSQQVILKDVMKSSIIQQYQEKEIILDGSNKFQSTVGKSHHSSKKSSTSSQKKDILLYRSDNVSAGGGGGGNNRIRYRDNIVVTHTGEKVITEKNPADDYDGGSRGRVKTKGKRGPGWV